LQNVQQEKYARTCIHTSEIYKNMYMNCLLRY